MASGFGVGDVVHRDEFRSRLPAAIAARRMLRPDPTEAALIADLMIPD